MRTPIRSLLIKWADASDLTQNGPQDDPSGLAFYTGEQYPKWKGNIFIGSLKYHRLERRVRNASGEPVRREYLLQDLQQRIRDVRQGPDGDLYVLTDEEQGALLRLAPIQARR